MAQECCEVYRVHQDIVDAVRKSMPDEDLICDLGELYKVFGDSTRIKILYVLFQSEMCVCDIAQLLNMGETSLPRLRAFIKAFTFIRMWYPHPPWQYAFLPPLSRKHQYRPPAPYAPS